MLYRMWQPDNETVATALVRAPVVQSMVLAALLVPTLSVPVDVKHQPCQTSANHAVIQQVTHRCDPQSGQNQHTSCTCMWCTTFTDMHSSHADVHISTCCGHCLSKSEHQQQTPPNTITRCVTRCVTQIENVCHV
jgi:hypothetical protein